MCVIWDHSHSRSHACWLENGHVSQYSDVGLLYLFSFRTEMKITHAPNTSPKKCYTRMTETWCCHTHMLLLHIGIVYLYVQSLLLQSGWTSDLHIQSTEKWCMLVFYAPHELSAYSTQAWRSVRISVDFHFWMNIHNAMLPTTFKSGFDEKTRHVIAPRDIQVPSISDFDNTLCYHHCDSWGNS